MTKRTSVWLALLLAGAVTLSAIPAGAEEPFFKARLGDTNYCYMKFPKIRESTLFTDKPELKSPSEGDLVYFHGPCDYDPLGKEEVTRQRNRRVATFSDS